MLISGVVWFPPSGGKWCRGVELNHRPRPYQGRALPLSYHGSASYPRSTTKACKRAFPIFHRARLAFHASNAFAAECTLTAARSSWCTDAAVSGVPAREASRAGPTKAREKAPREAPPGGELRGIRGDSLDGWLSLNRFGYSVTTCFRRTSRARRRRQRSPPGARLCGRCDRERGKLEQCS